MLQSSNPHSRYQKRYRMRKRIQTIFVFFLGIIIVFPAYFLFKKIVTGKADAKENTAGYADGETDNTAGTGEEDGSAVSSQDSALTGPYRLYCTPTPIGPSPTPVPENEIFMPDFVDTRTKVNVKGIYVTSDAVTKHFDTLLKMMDDTELNAIIVDIKDDDGRITYSMSDDIIDGYGTSKNYIADIDGFIKKCKEHNVYIIARVVAFKDPLLAATVPELALHHKDGTVYTDGSGIKWVNPFRQEVLDYLVDIAKQCAETGFNEINFDYFRFPTDGTVDDFDFGDGNEDKTKIDAITAAAKYLCENIKPLGVYVSVDVFGTVISSGVDQKSVGQDFAVLGKYLDYICPMIYPSHYGDGSYNIQYPDTEPYKLIYSALLDAKNVLSVIPDEGVNKAQVRPWLQDFTATWVTHHITYGAQQVRDQINAVYDAGDTGWSLWNAAVNYTSSALMTEEEADAAYASRPTPTLTPTPTPQAAPTKDPNRGQYIDSPWKSSETQ